MYPSMWYILKKLSGLVTKIFIGVWVKESIDIRPIWYMFCTSWFIYFGPDGLSFRECLVLKAMHCYSAGVNLCLEILLFYWVYQVWAHISSWSVVLLYRRMCSSLSLLIWHPSGSIWSSIPTCVHATLQSGLLWKGCVHSCSEISFVFY